MKPKKHETITRSEIMSLVKSKDTQPELIIRKGLHRAGFRFRLHSKTLPGKPDIVLKKYCAVVQVRGCFWHGHNCRAGENRPSTNYKYWKDKLDKNRDRDKKNDELLAKMGWNVIVVWECSLKNIQSRQQAINRLISDLKHLKINKIAK